MQDTLSFSLIQFNPLWEDKNYNIQKANELLKNLDQKPDVVIFPEMFLTGFSMNTENIAEPMDGTMVKWMTDTAATFNFTLMGSLPVVYEGKYHNRFIIKTPDNKTFTYDKRHLFRMGEEPVHFTGGNKLEIIPYSGWNIMPLVCYDLRFPVWSRNVNLGYDIIIYVACWPAARNDAFLTLLKARAIENSSYVIGVNRVGIDGNNISYIGNSVVFDPKGKPIAGLVENKETIINFSLSLSELRSYRQKFPSYLDGDAFSIKI